MVILPLLILAGTFASVLTASPPIPSGGEGGLTFDEITTLMAEHNANRDTFCSPHLVWNATLSNITYNYASLCNFTHNTNRNAACRGQGCGENIAAASSNQTNLYTGWAEEEPNWDCSTTQSFSAGCTTGVCDHWTQIIWNTTVSVGCGKVFCSENSPFGPSFPTWYFLVCDYYPPGNVLGEPGVKQCTPCSSGTSVAPPKFALLIVLALLSEVLSF